MRPDVMFEGGREPSSRAHHSFERGVNAYEAVVKLAHGLEHTENSPRGRLRHGETGEFPLFSVPRVEKLASVFSQPVVSATGC